METRSLAPLGVFVQDAHTTTSNAIASRAVHNCHTPRPLFASDQVCRTRMAPVANNRNKSAHIPARQCSGHTFPAQPCSKYGEASCPQRSWPNCSKSPLFGRGNRYLDNRADTERQPETPQDRSYSRSRNKEHRQKVPRRAAPSHRFAPRSR